MILCHFILRTVLHETTPHIVEDLHRQSLWIVCGFQHDGRHSGYEDRFGDPFRPVAPDVADN